MLRKAWEVIVLIVLVSLGINLAFQAIGPYLPYLGIGIVVVILIATAWLAYKVVSRRSRIP
jgi:hypothetical protein